ADIEWTVQLLQLRYAHAIEGLHNTSTLESLDAIAAADLISAEDADLLRQAWLTVTRARNALVLVRGKPSDQLPGPGRQLNTGALVIIKMPKSANHTPPPATSVRRRVSVEIPHEVMSADEHDRLAGLYGP